MSEGGRMNVFLRYFLSAILFTALCTIHGVTQDSSQTTNPSSASETAKQPPQQKPVGKANPASVNCVEKGGTLEIRKGKKSEYGVCKFPNGKECEEWAFFRGKCSPGHQPKGETPAENKPN